MTNNHEQLDNKLDKRGEHLIAKGLFAIGNTNGTSEMERAIQTELQAGLAWAGRAGKQGRQGRPGPAEVLLSMSNLRV